MDTRNVSILVVDDDRRTCTYLARILSAKDWRVDTACDGSTALALAQETPYNAILLDYRMPGMDGAELCRRIRERQPDVRAVFLTGFPSIDTVYPAMAAGGERVLSKPVKSAELVSTLEDELAKQAHDRGESDR
jgi:CheY-like chemotaxis protein